MLVPDARRTDLRSIVLNADFDPLAASDRSLLDLAIAIGRQIRSWFGATLR